MEQPINRRRWQRYPFDASLRVMVDDAPLDYSDIDPSGDELVVNGRGIQFSQGGIGLFAAANLPVGSQVKVEFRTPHAGEPVRVRGKVRNRSVYLYGVEFLSERREDRQKLARLSAEFGGLPSA